LGGGNPPDPKRERGKLQVGFRQGKEIHAREGDPEEEGNALINLLRKRKGRKLGNGAWGGREDASRS